MAFLNDELKEDGEECNRFEKEKRNGLFLEF
jgi:hypothetical protein